MGERRQEIFKIQSKYFVGFVIFTIAFVGMLSNGIVAIFTKRLPTMNNAFGKLTASQSTAETILCAIFCFYYTPMVVLESALLEYNSHHAGWINLICYDICIWSHLFISLNRLVAICFPFKYKLIFSDLHTTAMIVVSWIIPIITAVVFYKLHDCDFFFSSEYWAFVFPQTEICKFISWNIDFYKDLTIVVIISVVDMITIITVLRAKHLNTSSEHRKSQRKKEVNFLIQAVLQGIFFVVELLTYFFLAWRFENRWVIWSLTTLAWVIVHTADGLIIILYNREFRRLIVRPFRVKGGKVGSMPRENHNIENENALHPRKGSN